MATKRDKTLDEIISHSKFHHKEPVDLKTQDKDGFEMWFCRACNTFGKQLENNPIVWDLPKNLTCKE